MAKKVLLGYASLTGFTAEVAEAVAEEMRKAGLEVEAKRVRELRSGDLDGCSGVVLGTTIRAGHVQGSAVNFLKKNQAALSGLPVAYFSVGLRMADDTPAAREETEGYLRPLKELKEPVAMGLFAGALDLKKLSGPVRFLMSRIKDDKGETLKEGDFRNWGAIRAWAREVAGLLAGYEPMRG